MLNQADRKEFSHRTRAYNLTRMRAEQYDLVIIGGGINGAGIAREAAVRGYKVAVTEKNDFASGTSSQSSKLVHGGVRYLESYEFLLVHEASVERRRLLCNAPNYVWPLPFLYPIYQGNRYPPPIINLGLWMYDGLALFRNVENHKMLSTSQISAELPYLDTSRIIGGAQYYDAGMDDARLAFETMRSAHLNGAVVANHIQVEALMHRGQKVDGVVARDLLSGATLEVRGRIVVNATGPWTDQVLGLDSDRNPRRLRPTKGVHLLVRHMKFPVPNAVAFTPQDKRLMFVIPRGDFTLIGTTDTHYDGDPDRVFADDSDVDYILRSVAESFPGNPLTRADVISTYAGLRPLVAKGDANSPGKISREHQIWRTDSGLVNIAGGKYTTYRAMAQQLVEYVEPILKKEFGILAEYPSRTADLPLIEEDGASPYGRARTQNLANQTPRGEYWQQIREVWSGKGAGERHDSIWNRLSKGTRDHLARAYGARHSRVLDYIAGDSQLAAPIVEDYPYIWAEVPHAVEYEMALTVSDVMKQRLHLFHEVPDGAVDAARTIALYLGRMLELEEKTIEQQVSDYRQMVRQNRAALKKE